jgi:hypothetical protein
MGGKPGRTGEDEKRSSKMKKLIPGLFRWVSKSTPTVAVLLVAAGATGAYALGASGGGTDTTTKPAGPSTSIAFGPAGGGNLSDADRKSLEAFGTCMKDNTPQPGDGTQPPNPADGKAKFDAAFDKCKSNLSDTLQQKFEAQQKAMDAYKSCLDANGAPQPSAGAPPSKADIAAMEKAQKACADKLPAGAGPTLCVGGPGGPGGPGDKRGGPPGAFGMALPGPPPGTGYGTQSGSSSSGSSSSNN